MDDFDWESLPVPPSDTPFQDLAEQWSDQALEPIHQMQRQISELQGSIEAIAQEQRAVVERRSILFLLWLLFLGVLWIQVIHPLLIGSIRAVQSTSEAIAGEAVRPQRCIRMVMPSTGSITSRFGTRKDPFTGQPKMHEGLDFGAPQGSPVIAAVAGKVIQASDQGDGYGLTVIIDHGGGLETLYAHNSKVLVQVGQFIAQGTAIAQVGSTGRSTAPHLHFGVYLNERAVNPENLLNQNFGEECPQ